MSTCLSFFCALLLSKINLANMHDNFHENDAYDIFHDNFFENGAYDFFPILGKKVEGPHTSACLSFFCTLLLSKIKLADITTFTSPYIQCQKMPSI